MKVICDGSNLIHICWSIARKQKQDETGDKEYTLKQEDIPFFFHIFFRKITPILTNYKDIIFAMEGEGSLNWRRSIYPDYKMNRAQRNNEDEYKLLKSTFPKINEIEEIPKIKQWIKLFTQ